MHPSTIRRWIDRGRLPAYRLGEKRIGVKASDLTQLISRRAPRSGTERRTAPVDAASVGRLNSSERERGLRALAELERLDCELQQRRGGKPFGPSWLLLDQVREKRTHHLMREP